jgi:hypothetical protein
VQRASRHEPPDSPLLLSLKQDHMVLQLRLKVLQQLHKSAVSDQALW